MLFSRSRTKKVRMTFLSVFLTELVFHEIFGRIFLSHALVGPRSDLHLRSPKMQVGPRIKFAWIPSPVEWL